MEDLCPNLEKVRTKQTWYIENFGIFNLYNYI